MRISFFVVGRPAPQQRPRLNKNKEWLYSPKSEFYKAVVKTAGAYAPKTPISKPVRLALKFCYEPPKNRRGEIYKTSRADLDNLEKAVMDALTEAGIWQDDSLIVVKLTGKVYKDVPGVSVTVETLKNIRDFGKRI